MPAPLLAPQPIPCTRYLIVTIQHLKCGYPQGVSLQIPIFCSCAANGCPWPMAPGAPGFCWGFCSRWNSSSSARDYATPMPPTWWSFSTRLRFSPPLGFTGGFPRSNCRGCNGSAFYFNRQPTPNPQLVQRFFNRLFSARSTGLPQLTNTPPTAYQQAFQQAFTWFSTGFPRALPWISTGYQHGFPQAHSTPLCGTSPLTPTLPHKGGGRVLARRNRGLSTP
jgi:hypothetical protein